MKVKGSTLENIEKCETLNPNIDSLVREHVETVQGQPLNDEVITPIHKCVAGVDVHRMLNVVSIIEEQPNGSLVKYSHEFSGFKHDSKAMAAWLVQKKVELVVMESTGIYWKSLYSHLENAGLTVYVVNAHHVKQIPGRKTDINDSLWLAALARLGLAKPSFVPPQDLRELRLVSRRLITLIKERASEVNRLHKTLDDAGIKLGSVVSDIQGVSAKEIVRGLIENKTLDILLSCARGVMKRNLKDIRASLQGDLTPRHKFILNDICNSIDYFDQRIADFEKYLLDAMEPYKWAHDLLQTVPGINVISAAFILVEISDDMNHFGSSRRLARWAKLCPGNNVTAGKRISGRTGHGNSVIRYILCECANAARNTSSSLASKYRSLKIHMSHKRTIVAIAHKMIRIIFCMLSRHQPYIDPKIDYAELSAVKNAPRWIRQLKNIGKWPESNTENCSKTYAAN